MSVWCGVDLVHDSYFQLTGGALGGGVVNPLVTGSTATNAFVHGGVQDKFYLLGSCPVINSFDVLEKTGPGNYALDYPAYGETAYHAGILGSGLNAAGHDVRTMWFGFSFQYIRDDVAGAPIDRFEIFKDVKNAIQMGPGAPNITGDEIPRANRLSQNFPNPFNPSTTIRYDVQARGLVTVKIFDVSGRLVSTIVNGAKDAGSYSVVWDGTNDGGAPVASGIYFCKMETTGFVAVKKLVLLR
jgi:hypothetical protein